MCKKSLPKSNSSKPANKRLRRRWTDRGRKTKTSIGIQCQTPKAIIDFRNILKTKKQKSFNKKNQRPRFRFFLERIHSKQSMHETNKLDPAGHLKGIKSGPQEIESGFQGRIPPIPGTSSATSTSSIFTNYLQNGSIYSWVVLLLP